ncbi:HAD hydrolase family protein [Nocardioides sp. NBC_00163]|uniref:HAD family hydrolase n=1 Tax=Nocardioides sp. NBC_00163 TaxID=2975999 RepID=UPI0032499678
MSTLILSDLDGTLLGPGASLSTSTRDGINDLVANGLQFTYATARSYVSAARVTDGLDLRVPVTVSGGAFQLDPDSGAILNEERIPDDDLDTVLRLCREHRVPPTVYNGTPMAERGDLGRGRRVRRHAPLPCGQGRGPTVSSGPWVGASPPRRRLLRNHHQ